MKLRSPERKPFAFSCDEQAAFMQRLFAVCGISFF